MPKWEYFPDYDAMRCPICKAEYDDSEDFEYCPRCGSRIFKINDYEKMMINTMADWMKEYPTEWIEYAYNKTVRAFRNSPLSMDEFLERMRADRELQQNDDKKG